jgi:Cft2 family RNA processing exonuclease
VKIKFLGAERQVTGSCYYLEAEGLRLLVDCGLFQEREYLSHNWEPFAFDLAGLVAKELGWRTRIPGYLDEVELNGIA